jgi:ribosome-binding protein aMBF1 (putative translation factor)
MSEPIASQIVSRRRLLWFAAMAAATAVPASMLQVSDACAQSDQAPAAEPSTPMKKTKSKSKTKKTTPGDTMAPAAKPAPKQQ